MSEAQKKPINRTFIYWWLKVWFVGLCIVAGLNYDRWYVMLSCLGAAYYIASLGVDYEIEYRQ